MGKIRIRGGRQGGQTLIIFAIAMPLFLSLVALVVDGSSLMVHRRSLQVAADAAALAVAQDLNNPSCPSSCLASEAGEYSSRNGGTDSVPACTDSSDTNCYQTPYKGNPDLVEVRLTSNFTGFFASAIGFSNLFGVSARAVAGIGYATSATVITGTTDPGSTDPNVTIPGGTHTTTDPGTEVGEGGIAFTMSRTCGAIGYTGAGSDGTPLGSFATNGGLTFAGFGNPKKVTSLYYNKVGCSNDPPSPPSGTGACTSTVWGDATTSNNLCVKTLVDLNINNTLPINWPVTPPTPPTLKAGNTWDPSTDYPSKCLDPGTTSITGNGWANTHPPGIYCVTGAGTTLTFGGGQNGADVSRGDGYTFFALGGAKIATAGKTTIAKFYWPSACGPRPTTRPASFTCSFTPSRTISGYDAQTLFYATYASGDGNCAICLNGNGGNLTGDIFAPKPDVFPPGPTDTGALVFISGGALTAGSGFIESWMLTIQGNSGSYRGTGAPIAIPGGTHTTTDPDTVITGTTRPGTTDPGTTQIITTDTNFDLDE